jgi:DNA repair photolyase
MTDSSSRQFELFDEPAALPKLIGPARIESRPVARILNRATGFVRDFDYTLNPYQGCQFGCAYCYAVFFVPTPEHVESWGRWVHVKTTAVEQIRRSRMLAGSSVYMSTVTDPYQPVESRIGLTRELLEQMAPESRQPRLVIQTRSPLVTRDIDLFRQFRNLRVNVSVTTDSEIVRKQFEPGCPSIRRRMDSLEALKSAGIKTSVCLTPLLPVENPAAFARDIASLRADVYVVQPFHASRGPFAAGTRTAALAMARDYGWNDRAYRSTVRELTAHLPGLHEGRAGFMPE